MDPFSLIFILLAIYGGLHAVKNGVKVGRASAALSRTSAQGKLPKGSNRQIMADTRRRATVGWWAREVGNGFPVTLGGVRQGWAAHNEAHAEHAANTTEKRATVAERIADHKRRMEAAQARLDAAKPDTSVLPIPVRVVPGHPVMAPPPPVSQAPASQAAGTNGQTSNTQPISPEEWMNDPSATCSDPTCPYCHVPSGSNGTSGQPSGQPSASPTGGTMSDLSYDGMIATCEKIQHHIDQTVHTQELSEAETMADQMGPALPDDTESLGLVGDLVSALHAVKAAQMRAAELAQALKNTIEKNHGAANEAAKATGHMAERGVHTSA